MHERMRNSVGAVWSVALNGLPVAFLVLGLALIVIGYLQTDTILHGSLLSAGSVILASGACAAILKSVIIASETSQWRSWLEDYLAGMIVTAVVAPGFATAITLLIAIHHWLDNGWALLLGAVGGVSGGCSAPR